MHEVSAKHDHSHPIILVLPKLSPFALCFTNLLWFEIFGLIVKKFNGK